MADLNETQTYFVNEHIEDYSYLGLASVIGRTRQEPKQLAAISRAVASLWC